MLTNEELLQLRKHDRIEVRKSDNRGKFRKALVLGTPEVVGNWILVDYALIVGGDWDVRSATSHVAAIGPTSHWTIVRAR